jgi:hypothetical protein
VVNPDARTGLPGYVSVAHSVFAYDDIVETVTDVGSVVRLEE